MAALTPGSPLNDVRIYTTTEKHFLTQFPRFIARTAAVRREPPARAFSVVEPTQRESGKAGKAGAIKANNNWGEEKRLLQINQIKSMIFLLPLCYVMFLPDCGTGARGGGGGRNGKDSVRSRMKISRNTLFLSVKEDEKCSSPELNRFCILHSSAALIKISLFF